MLSTSGLRELLDVDCDSSCKSNRNRFTCRPVGRQTLGVSSPHREWVGTRAVKGGRL